MVCGCLVFDKRDNGETEGEGNVTVSKVDPCGICGKRVMGNSVL